MGIRHTVPSGLPTGTVSGKVAGDDWRADHLHVPFSVEMLLSNNTYVNGGLAASAAANVEVNATGRSCRNKIDLSQATQVRLVAGVGVTGNAAGGSYKLSYCTVENATWSSGTGVADAGVAVVLGTNGGAANLIHDSGWQTLAVGARIDNCYLTLLVGTAIGSTQPTVSYVTAYFR